MLGNRRFVWIAVLATVGILFFWTRRETFGPIGPGLAPAGAGAGTAPWPVPEADWRRPGDEGYLWRTVKVNHPVTSFQPLPTGPPSTFPKVQADFPLESDGGREQRIDRQQSVKQTFLRAWTAYKKHAWMADELEPVSAGKRNPFGGWAATLVDALDTLWIMDLRDEFEDGVAAVEEIDFTHTELDQINVFETTIRYLGGFISAYELSGDGRLLRKAAEVGEMIYKTFDTPNHMPALHWNTDAGARGDTHEAGTSTLSAEIGSLCMELTRLSQLTGDAKWFDAAQRITDAFAAQQDGSEIPGLWPLLVNAKDVVFNKGSNTFTLGAMADSLYEYLPKMAAMLGGQVPAYQTMYEKAMDAASKQHFFRPMTPTNADILVSGQVKTGSKGSTDVMHEGQHLVCFAGGMLALGGKLFNRPHDVELGTKLTDGCIYAYKAFPHGIMPETFHMAACPSTEGCEWDEAKWKKEVLEANSVPEADPDGVVANERLPPGFTRVPDRRYILRPEAIESVFILYRATGRQEYADAAWDMFTAIDAATKTELANSAVGDVTTPGLEPPRDNSMESFWMGETLKYFYLVFSEPHLISLDDYVFNTEAHPFRRWK